MLSKYDIALYKEELQGRKLIYALVHEREFLFKTLTRKEYRDILDIAVGAEEIEDAICQTALVYPEDFNFSESPLAGVSTHMAPIIQEQSGFTSLELVLETFDVAKANMKIFEEQCMMVVKAAMPDITYDEMEDWTWEKLMQMSARAEGVLHLLGHDDIQLTDTREEVKKKTEEQQINRKEVVKQLRAEGIDPMFYFQHELNLNPEYIDSPLLGGVHWDNEGVLNAIRQQMERSTKR